MSEQVFTNSFVTLYLHDGDSRQKMNSAHARALVCVCARIFDFLTFFFITNSLLYKTCMNM